MKKKLVVGLLLAVAVVGYSVMPKMVESSIPTAYYITPNLKTYENVIHCTGTVQSKEVYQVVLSSSLVAKEVLVSVGDEVEEGDVLIRVDGEKTGDLGLSLGLGQELAGDSGAVPASGIDWAALASSYGLSAAVSGDQIDASLMEALFGNSGLLAGQKTGGMTQPDPEGEIAAPMSGVVTELAIQKDIPAAAGKAVVTIADDRNYKVLAAVREEDIGRVQVGDSAKVRGVGFSGAVYQGIVTKIAPTARKMLSGTTSETVVDVEVELLDADQRLKAGFSAKVEILAGSSYDLITVPYEAIRQDEKNNEYVYLYRDGKLQRQVVVTGQELVSEVEILEGISYDSVVVMNPSNSVKEGAMIHIVGRADADVD